VPCVARCCGSARQVPPGRCGGSAERHRAGKARRQGAASRVLCRFLAVRNDEVFRRSMRLWVVQADIDGGHRDGVPTSTLEELAALKAENRRLRETNEMADPAQGVDFLRRGTRPPRSLIEAFIDVLVAEGFAVESICTVLRSEGLSGRGEDLPQLEAGRPAGRRPAGERRGRDRRAARDPRHPRGRLRAPEDDGAAAPARPHGLPPHGRPADARPRAPRCSSRQEGPHGGAGPGRQASEPAADLLERDVTAAEPNQRCFADVTYVRTWAGWVFVAFVVDVYAQRIVGWHASTTRTTDLVLTCCGWRSGSASMTATPSPRDS
jgi:hypothetical protein